MRLGILSCGKGEKRYFYRKKEGRYFFHRLPENFLLKEDLPPDVRHVCDAVVRVHGHRSQTHMRSGTGFFTSKGILTALHVMEDALRIYLVDGERGGIKAKEIERDEDSDLALLESKEMLAIPDIVLSAEGGLGDGELYVFGFLFLGVKRWWGRSAYIEHLCAYKVESTARRNIKEGKFSVTVPPDIVGFFRGFSGGVLVDSCGVVRGMLLWITPASIRGVHGSIMSDFLNRSSDG